MPRKNLIAACCVAAGLTAGCASLRPPNVTPAPPAETPTAQPAPAQKPRPRPTTPSVAQQAPRPAVTPRATLPIRGSVTKEGGSLLVTRGTAGEPVPLFRQAIVLANVRAAVAGLPAQPQAEFQRGLLTLTFPRGTQPEVATAINRTLAIPEVTRLRVIPPP
jgi:hypothetical protein